MNESVELSDELLLKAGGSREMKEARKIHASGVVTEARYENGILEALVPQKGKATKVRLKIHSPTNMENHCPCFPARRDGIICAHVLAAGLEVIDPKSAPKSVISETPEKMAPPKISEAWPICCEEFEAEATPAELLVILPPNLPAAWEKNRIMAGVEVEIEGQRKLLAAVSPRKRLFLGPRDAALFSALRDISPTAVPGMMRVGQENFLKLLEALAGHPRVFIGRSEPLQVAFAPLRPPIQLSGHRFRIDWPNGVSPLIGENSTWAISGKTLHPVAPGLPERFRPIFDHGYAIDPAAIRTEIALLEDAFEFEEATFERLPQPAVPEIELDLQGSLNRITARLTFCYGDKKTTSAATGIAHFVEAGDRTLVTSPTLENRAIAKLRQFGFSEPDADGRQRINDRNAILRFFAHGFPKLDEEWTITTGAGFDHGVSQVEPVTAVFDFHSSGENWFEMAVEFESESAGPIPRAEIQRLIQSGRCDRKTKAGRIAVIDSELISDLSEVIADCDPQQHHPGTFQIDQLQAGYLKETANDESVRLKGNLPWNQPIATKIPFPADLDEIFRPYQRTGVEWLLALANRGMGGILADDMGLGKTLQTLALIKAAGGKALVVCPSSLVFNWIAEAEKFTPDLKAVAIDGPDRAEKLVGPGANADLLVTSYALLRIDADIWQKREFDVVILDEAQQIRNPDAQVTKAAHRIRARHRFALTGTPIENSVRDLWSIMQFVLPGYLGNRQEFSERFEKPIGKGDAPDLRRRLSRRLRPVVLRRLKREVAADLPEKIEQVVYCELNAGQKAIYDQILRESRETIFDAEGGRKRMLALTALLRLRQACCDLRLLGLPDLDPDQASIKMDALDEMLTEAVESGHKVLIFSQFVQMLQALVPMLAERGLKYCYLDGRTKRRGEEVARFQENDDIPIFLISLKAGGVGLNLTAADTVIHIDPWWNPAVEAQATDRAHRIGQERIVTSYKLIARNTVEEKILALQAKKKAMMESILEGDSEANFGDAALSEEELLEMFES